jgi:RHS repeat-associated protein
MGFWVGRSRNDDRYLSQGHKYRHTTTGTTSPFGYAGQYTDTETGLQWLRAGYYDPTTAQFLTVDPLAAATGARYTYTRGNPITSADPTGLCNPVSLAWWSEDSCLGPGIRAFGDTLRLPDYVTIDLAWVAPLGMIGPVPVGIGGDLTATLTRDGNVYGGLGPEVGTAFWSGSVRGGWLNQTDRPCASTVDQFVSGLSTTESGTFPGPVGISAGETQGYWGTATEAGIGMGTSLGASGTYSWQTAFHTGGW